MKDKPEQMMETPAEIAAGATPRTRQIVPWVECNRWPDVDNVVEGLNIWASITDTAIVSTGLGMQSLYHELDERVPGMKIVAGLKTSYPLYVGGGFDSARGWEMVADFIDTCPASDMFLFEHESAIAKYIDGSQGIDLDLLRGGLKLLPAAKYLWYPSAGGSGDVLRRYLDLAAVVDEMLDVQLVDHASLFGPSFVSQPGTIACADALRATVKRTVPMAYTIGREPHWTYSQVPYALRYADSRWGADGWTILYPGGKSWVEAAALVSAIILKLEEEK